MQQEVREKRIKEVLSFLPKQLSANKGQVFQEAAAEWNVLL